MLGKFVWFVAVRYFRAKKNEKLVSVISAFSLLGVTIGVAALIVVMAVMKGFHNEFVKNIIGLDGTIAITATSGYIQNPDEVKEQLAGKDYISYIANGVTGKALAMGNNASGGALIRGISLEDLEHKNQILRNVISGDFDDFTCNDCVALGHELAYSLNAKVGDKIRLISTNIISTAFGSMPRSKEFSVIAIFSSGMYEYDKVTALMPVMAAQKFLSLGEAVNLVEIYTKNPDLAVINGRDIQKIIGGGFRVKSWQQSNMQFLNALATERIAMFTILSLIILVAAFNIISSLFMLVKDKTKDIAILKTIGASQLQIMLIFVCNGMFIGIIGTTFGVLVGTSFAYNIQSIRAFLERITDAKLFDAAIYFLYNLPSDVRGEDVAMIALLAVGLCFVATLYPSYKASKLNPVDALRYE